MKLLTLRESVTSKPSKVDWAKGIIYGVKVLAETSKNNFVYPRETRVKAHKLLEGLRVNIDHLKAKNAKDDVPYEARFGKLINVREGDRGTYADLKFNVKHRLAESISYAAEHLHDTLGMSINGGGIGGGRTADGKKIVTEIVRLRSCDLVADPGSTETLFESAPVDDELPGTDPGVAASLTGMKATITHFVENAADEAALVAALKQWCEKYDKGDDDEEEEDVEESLDEAAQLARLQAEKACLVLCESLKVQPSSDLISLMADLPTEEKRKALVAKIGVKLGVKAPKSAPINLRESAPVPTATPEEARKRVTNLLRGRN